MSAFFRAGLTAIVSLLCFFAAAQSPVHTTYYARNVHSSRSTELIRELNLQLSDELRNQGVKYNFLITRIYSNRTAVLVDAVKKLYFINDDTSQRLVDEVKDSIVAANRLTRVPRRILLSRDPTPNASSYGEGTLIVNIGLLSKLENESQLAFVMAHEIAHYELNHSIKMIRYAIERDRRRNSARTQVKILSGEELTVEDMETLKKLVYNKGEFDRRSELQADSLALILMKNAGYRQHEAITGLVLMDFSRYGDPLGSELFAPFHFSRFPFQEYWLKPRLSAYNQKEVAPFYFSLDSIRSHPDIGLRTERLQQTIAQSEGPVLNSNARRAQLEKVKMIAKFESAQTAYAARQYDRCLWLCLQLYREHPDNSFLVAMITTMFLDLYDAHERGLFSTYVKQRTFYNDKDLIMVNNFLHNISPEEMIELAYHFINLRSNFNREKENHYFMLWRICDLTEREQMKDKIKEAYVEKFGKGRYYSRMR